MVLKKGDKAPSFKLEGSDGNVHKLADYNKVVLYFYPKDNTPGCTTQACNFRDGMSELEKEGYTVFGVSADSVDSHKKFSSKHGLNFVLLSDPAKEVIKAYDALKQKSMFGKTFMGIQRCTYVIENGVIVKVIEKSSPSSASDEILR